MASPPWLVSHQSAVAVCVCIAVSMLAPCSSAIPVHVQVTQIPAEKNLTLSQNSSILLQFHIEGEVMTGRSTVYFHDAQQDSCSDNYITHFDSKPLVENASLVCEEAYWSRLDQHQHQQKLEVRLTNGIAAMNVSRVTVRLHLIVHDRSMNYEFRVTLWKSGVTTPSIPSSTKTEMGGASQTTDKEQPTEGSATKKEISLANKGITHHPAINVTNSAHQNFGDLLKSSKQYQITMGVGLAMLAVILGLLLVVACLVTVVVTQRRTANVKLLDVTS